MISRWILAGPLAMIVTGLLALTMMKLIDVQFIAAQAAEALSFEINPKVADIVPLHKISPPKLNRVEIPPAMPDIDRQATARPSEGGVKLDNPIKDLILPEPVIDRTFVVMTDSNPSPVLRFKPVMPPKANKSGHCKMRFAVNAEGAPFEIEALFCTETLFKRNSVKAVQKFKYRPKIEDGLPVAMHGVTTIIRYNLVDEKGQIIPE